MNSFFKLSLIVIVLFGFSACEESGVTKTSKELLETPIDIEHLDRNETAKIEQQIKPKKKKRLNPKKEKFKEIMVPIVTEVYTQLEKKYQRLKLDVQNNRNKEEIALLKKEYKAKSDHLLLQAIKPHPISIVLAQSAIESAWLGSRFAKDANNIFGVWSFNKDEPRIAATGARGDKIIYLKKYSSYKEAVEDYYKSIGKSWAYKKLRHLRTVTDNPDILLPYLKSYSEKGDKYIEVLRKLIKYNEFNKYNIKKSK
ncbi:MAG: glucosaminidase domain-containing protein [Campylobacterota bacterium]|nr:glucosaminidase domain-containing protein [Campylobacterota bacterium]